MVKGESTASPDSLPFGDPQPYRVDLITSTGDFVGIGTLIKIYGTDSEEVIFLGRVKSIKLLSEAQAEESEDVSFLCERLV